MSLVRSKALYLRLKGHSYNEIAKALSVSKSTLSLWLRDVVLSESAQKRLQGRKHQGLVNSFLKRNKLQTHLARQRAQHTRQVAQKTLPRLNERDLLIAGICMYWAEGYKRLKVRDGKERTSHIISFVNSDAEMISVFIHFLQRILKIAASDILLTMRLYPHINENEAKLFWTKIAKLPQGCFRKTTFLVSGASKGKRPYIRLPYGTLQVAVYDTQKFHHLMGLIEGVKNNFLRDKITTTSLG